MKYVEKCRNADKYKAQRKSTCGCFVCDTLWRLNQLEQEVVQLRQIVGETNQTSIDARQGAATSLYVANYCKRS